MYKLLIVDDEERIRKGMETIIDWKAFGFTELYSADNGRNGVLKAKEVRPDLVIADLYMPGVDGIQMIRQLRADGLNCQFIILSGVKDFQYAREAIDLQVATYLLKPIQEDELTRKVASLFGEQSASAAQDAQDMPAASVMARIRSYIEKNCGGPVTLNMIADEFHFSTPYLGRIFKKVTGETFHDYLERTRMEKAKALLNSGNKVYVVAKQVGYANVDYFADKFKNYTGVTPNEYKRRKLIP